MNRYERHTLILNGTVMASVGLNGTSYVSDEPLDVETLALFRGTVVDITDETGEQREYRNVCAAEQRRFADGYYIALMQKTAQEIKSEETQAQIDDLVLMMADLIGGGETV